jgi:LysR family hydrogen peroxide-inducible transcriptional activator
LKQAQPWLLNSSNCLRTQMMHFCRLSEAHNSEWNYEGGNLQMLVGMVDQYGGYTLIPEFYQKQYGLDPALISHATSPGNQGFPARNIIAVSSHKNSRHPALQELIRFIKLEYANQEQKKFEVLSWK